MKENIWQVRELKEKIVRLNGLRLFNLNVPRFFYLQKRASDDDFDRCLEWAEEIKKENLEQIFNIRTYDYQQIEKIEQLSCPHHTDISTIHNLEKILWNLNGEYYCMVDAEIPDDGRYAGNVGIYKDLSMPDGLRFNIDYCKKEKRAMVRDADISISGIIDQYYEDLVLTNVLEVAKGFIEEKGFLNNHPSVIMEWTYFCKKTGTRGENLVWWEYRLK